jgi:cystathionine beta-lyase/cystathionine gamma-synthase
MSKIRSKKYSLSTRLIHAGEQPDKETGAVAPVLIRSKTYAWNYFDADPEYKYSRSKNPTRTILENKISELESVEKGKIWTTVFASGVAAEFALFLTLSPGDHIIFSREVYGGTYRLIENVLSRFGITGDYVDFNNLESVRKIIKPSTKYFFVETPTNPSLHIVDLKKVQTLSKETGIPFIVDATFAPPITTDSFEFGAETVIYSLSKYYAGHNDAIAGAVVTRNKELDAKLRFYQGAIGAVLSPDECYRVIQGIKTLEIRLPPETK